MPQPATSAGAGLAGLLPFIFIILIFYFILIRPQMKTEKQKQKMRGALKKDDRVVTGSGIFGTIVDLKEDRVILKVDENTKIMVLRSSISHLEKSA